MADDDADDELAIVSLPNPLCSTSHMCVMQIDTDDATLFFDQMTAQSQHQRKREIIAFVRANLSNQSPGFATRMFERFHLPHETAAAVYKFLIENPYYGPSPTAPPSTPPPTPTPPSTPTPTPPSTPLPTPTLKRKRKQDDDHKHEPAVGRRRVGEADNEVYSLRSQCRMVVTNVCVCVCV